MEQRWELISDLDAHGREISIDRSLLLLMMIYGTRMSVCLAHTLLEETFLPVANNLQEHFSP